MDWVELDINFEFYTQVNSIQSNPNIQHDKKWIVFFIDKC